MESRIHSDAVDSHCPAGGGGAEAPRRNTRSNVKWVAGAVLLLLLIGGVSQNSGCGTEEPAGLEVPGEAGSAGAQGETGPQGEAGPQGPAGTPGSTGPVGAVVAFAGPAPVASSVPSGWLLCDGREVSRTTYADLYGVIGGLWGTGDGVTTFNLPDLRGRFLRGRDGGAGNDPNAGSRTECNPGGATGDSVGSLQDDATSEPKSGWTVSGGSHSHPIDLAYAGGPESNRAVRAGNGNASDMVTGSSSHNHNITGGDSETRPINAYVNYLIKH